MRYAYQAYKGTQLIEFAGFVGQISVAHQAMLPAL